MTIPLEGRLKGRQTAPFHGQLELEKSEDFDALLGERRIYGRTVRVFRSDGRVSVGDRLGFALWVCHPGDIPTGPAFIFFDDLKPARYMEAYLYGDPPECELAAYEFTVIRTPSDEPTLTPRQLEELLEELRHGRRILENAKERE